MSDTFDPYPQGYMNTGTLSPDDPLLDWGSNMKPTDLFQYTHDPEGFKQKMIDAGIPPPDHSYTPTAQGLKAVDSQGQPVMRGMKTKLPSEITGEAFGFQGEGRGGALPFAGGPDTTLKPEEQGPNPIVEGAKKRFEKAGESKPYPSKEQPGTPPLLRQPPTGPGIVSDPSQGNLTGPVIADPAEAKRRMQERFAPFAGKPAGAQPAEAKPHEGPVQAAPPLPPAQTVQPLPPVVPQVDSLNPTQKAEVIAKKTGEEVARQELDKFAKSLQGIKAPTPPPLNAVGTPGVRQASAVHPTVQNLLGLAGQHPTAVASLMRLLGRA